MKSAFSNMAESLVYLALLGYPHSEAIGNSPCRTPTITELIDGLKNSNENVRIRAAKALSNRGEDAKQAVPFLIEILKGKDSDSRSAAIHALIALDQVSLPFLIHAISGDNLNTNVAQGAILALKGIGAKASKAVPDLVKLAQHPNADIRGRAVNSLAYIDREAAVPLLISMFKSDSAVENRQQAAFTLAHMGAKANPAIPAFLEEMRKKNNMFQPSLALGGIKIESLLAFFGSPAVPHLINILQNQNTEQFLRLRAISCLETMANVVDKKAPTDALPALIQIVRGKDEEAKLSALAAFEAMGKEAKPAMEVLKAALTDGSPLIRIRAATTIHKVDPSNLIGIPILIQALNDPNDSTRDSAVQAIGGFGSSATAAVPALISMLGDTNSDIRTSAAYALGRIGPSAKNAIPALEKRLNDNESDVRKAAKLALGKIDENYGKTKKK